MDTGSGDGEDSEILHRTSEHRKGSEARSAFASCIYRLRGCVSMDLELSNARIQGFEPSGPLSEFKASQRSQTSSHRQDAVLVDPVVEPPFGLGPVQARNDRRCALRSGSTRFRHPSRH